MLTAAQIRNLLEGLNAALAAEQVVGEVYLVGGAVMTLAFAARPSTNDVDAVFAPAGIIRRLAQRVAEAAGVDPAWLNDAVKGYLSDRGDFISWLELSHLRVFVPVPEYLLAMKCLAFRLGPEFHDEADVRYLLRYLNLESVADAFAVVERYYPPERIPAKTRYALEELLG
jgi:hypothetical protein